MLLLETARNIDPAVIDLTVAYTDIGKDRLAPELERYAAVACLGASSVTSPAWLLELRSLVRKRSIDLIHSHAPVTAIGARLVASTSSARPCLVVTHHAVWHSYRRPSRALDRVTTHSDDCVLVVSEAVRSSLPPSISRRARVLRLGVDIKRLGSLAERRSQKRDELNIDAGRIVLTSVANLHALKDHHTLLEAILRLSGRVPEFLLLLVGDGPLREELERTVHRLGLEGVVRFLGRRLDAAAIVAASDVFVLSSHTEGLPVSVMEAMAVAVPVVATDVGGVREALGEGGAGLLVPPRSPELMAEALQRLLTDGDLRRATGSAGALRARTFDAAAAVEELSDLYSAVVASSIRQRTST